MYVRKVKKAGKTYLYYYKSQRVGDKVRSIYVGKVLEKPKRLVQVTQPKQEISYKSLKNTQVVNNLIEFDKLLFEINKHIAIKDLKNSIDVYNQMLELYSKLEIQYEDKQLIFNKLTDAYNELLNLSKEHKIEVPEYWNFGS